MTAAFKVGGTAVSGAPEEDRKTQVERAMEKLKEKISKPGALGLPPLLDQRRLEYLIPDEAFACQPLFDTVYVRQLSDKRGRTYIDGGVIQMPETREGRERYSGSRGILVAASADAMDFLTSHGVQLGHMVRLLRMSPFYVEVANVEGVPIELMILRTGDLRGSFDVMSELQNGNLRLQVNAERQHYYADKDGKHYVPTRPSMGDDY